MCYPAKFNETPQVQGREGRKSQKERWMMCLSALPVATTGMKEESLLCNVMLLVSHPTFHHALFPIILPQLLEFCCCRGESEERASSVAFVSHNKPLVI